MNNLIKRIGVLTSGGDAPGMNAAVRGVVRTAAYYKIEAAAIFKGYQGLIDNDIKMVNPRSVNNIINKVRYIAEIYIISTNQLISLVLIL